MCMLQRIDDCGVQAARQLQHTTKQPGAFSPHPRQEYCGRLHGRAATSSHAACRLTCAGPIWLYVVGVRQRPAHRLEALGHVAHKGVPLLVTQQLAAGTRRHRQQRAACALCCCCCCCWSVGCCCCCRCWAAACSACCRLHTSITAGLVCWRPLLCLVLATCCHLLPLCLLLLLLLIIWQGRAGLVPDTLAEAHSWVLEQLLHLLARGQRVVAMHCGALQQRLVMLLLPPVTRAGQGPAASACASL
jgi:hypothetical protein